MDNIGTCILYSVLVLIAYSFANVTNNVCKMGLLENQALTLTYVVIMRFTCLYNNVLRTLAH